MIVTKTGMTPEYSAPEAYRGLFLEESDYYSFGSTLSELFCGKSPYRGLSAEEIAKYTTIQRIPLSSDMPQELKDLITALTYYDITNRNEKKTCINDVSNNDSYCRNYRMWVNYNIRK